MHNNIPEHAVAEITGPLTQVRAQLEPHSSKIQASWQKMLGRYVPCNKHSSLLSGLDVAQRMKDFCDTPAGAWRTHWEEQGHELARRGVPAECVGVAILLYVESCLPAPHGRRSPGGDPSDGCRLYFPGAGCISSFSSPATPGSLRWKCMRWASASPPRNAATRTRRSNLGMPTNRRWRRLARDHHHEIGHDLIVLK